MISNVSGQDQGRDMEVLEKLEAIHKERGLRQYLNNIYVGGVLTERVRLWYSTVVLIILFIFSAWSSDRGSLLLAITWSALTAHDFRSKLMSDHKYIYEEHREKIKRYRDFHQYPRYELFKQSAFREGVSAKEISKAIDYLEVENKTEQEYYILSNPVIAIIGAGFVGVLSSSIANLGGIYIGLGVLFSGAVLLWFAIALIPEKLKHMRKKELLRFLLWYKLELRDDH